MKKYQAAIKLLDLMIKEDPRLSSPKRTYAKRVLDKLEFSLQYMISDDKTNPQFLAAIEKTIKVIDNSTKIDNLKKLSLPSKTSL